MNTKATWQIKCNLVVDKEPQWDKQTNKQQVKPNKVKASCILGEEEFRKALLSLASVKDVSSSAVSLFSQFQHCSLEVSLTFHWTNKLSKRCNPHGKITNLSQREEKGGLRQQPQKTTSFWDRWARQVMQPNPERGREREPKQINHKGLWKKIVR